MMSRVGDHQDIPFRQPMADIMEWPYVNVRQQAGSCLRIPLTSDEWTQEGSVRVLKEKIKTLHGCKIRQQLLFCRGQRLFNDWRLIDAAGGRFQRLNEAPTVNLVLRLHGRAMPYRQIVAAHRSAELCRAEKTAEGHIEVEEESSDSDGEGVEIVDGRRVPLIRCKIHRIRESF